MSRDAIIVADRLTRLRRIEGQVRGLQHMLERDDTCVELLTQIKSVTRALDSVAMGVLDEHIRDCVARASGAEPARVGELVNDVTFAVGRLTRTSRMRSSNRR